MSRNPAVAGMFYPGDSDKLNDQLDRLLPEKESRKKAIGIISPHAGYVYSGGVAGEVISSVVIPPKVILLGPNHTGVGTLCSIMTSGSWTLPNGKVKIDTPLAERIMAETDLAHLDETAHVREHSLEVQIPFLIHEKPDVSIVPISLMWMKLKACRELGAAISNAVKGCDEEVLILASSDMTHYESAAAAKEKDRMAIDKVLDLDPEGLFHTVMDTGISMCGVIPATVMLFAAKALGAANASLVKYATSGDVTGDDSQVVGYAGMVIV